MSFEPEFSTNFDYFNIYEHSAASHLGLCCLPMSHKKSPGLYQLKCHNAKKPSPGFPAKSDTKQPVQSQKQVRRLKFWIYEEEDFYYQCSKSKGVDQLCSYCTPDMHLCFRIYAGVHLSLIYPLY